MNDDAMEEALFSNADAYGKEAQMVQTMEEMAELTQALSKYIRYCIHGGGREYADIRMNIKEEIADVEVMLEQIKYLLDIPDEDIGNIKLRKIARMTDQRKRAEKNGEP